MVRCVRIALCFGGETGDTEREYCEMKVLILRGVTSLSLIALGLMAYCTDTCEAKRETDRVYTGLIEAVSSEGVVSRWSSWKNIEMVRISFTMVDRWLLE